MYGWKIKNSTQSVTTLEKRESQRAKMEAAKRAGKIAYFVLDKLVIRDRPNVENS